jgi:hypothetical protein
MALTRLPLPLLLGRSFSFCRSRGSGDLIKGYVCAHVIQHRLLKKRFCDHRQKAVGTLLVAQVFESNVATLNSPIWRARARAVPYLEIS